MAINPIQILTNAGQQVVSAVTSIPTTIQQAAASVAAKVLPAVQSTVQQPTVTTLPTPYISTPVQTPVIQQTPTTISAVQQLPTPFISTPTTVQVTTPQGIQQQVPAPFISKPVAVETSLPQTTDVMGLKANTAALGATANALDALASLPNVVSMGLIPEWTPGKDYLQSKGLSTTQYPYGTLSSWSAGAQKTITGSTPAQFEAYEKTTAFKNLPWYEQVQEGIFKTVTNPEEMERVLVQGAGLFAGGEVIGAGLSSLASVSESANMVNTVLNSPIVSRGTLGLYTAVGTYQAAGGIDTSSGKIAPAVGYPQFFSNIGKFGTELTAMGVSVVGSSYLKSGLENLPPSNIGLSSNTKFSGITYESSSGRGVVGIGRERTGVMYIPKSGDIIDYTIRTPEVVSSALFGRGEVGLRTEPEIMDSSRLLKEPYIYSPLKITSGEPPSTAVTTIKPQYKFTSRDYINEISNLYSTKEGLYVTKQTSLVNTPSAGYGGGVLTSSELYEISPSKWFELTGQLPPTEEGATRLTATTSRVSELTKYPGLEPVKQVSYKRVRKISEGLKTTGLFGRIPEVGLSNEELVKYNIKLSEDILKGIPSGIKIGNIATGKMYEPFESAALKQRGYSGKFKEGGIVVGGESISIGKSPKDISKTIRSISSQSRAAEKGLGVSTTSVLKRVEPSEKFIIERAKTIRDLNKIKEVYTKEKIAKKTDIPIINIDMDTGKITKFKKEYLPEAGILYKGEMGYEERVATLSATEGIRRILEKSPKGFSPTELPTPIKYKRSPSKIKLKVEPAGYEPIKKQIEYDVTKIQNDIENVVTTETKKEYSPFITKPSVVSPTPQRLQMMQEEKPKVKTVFKTLEPITLNIEEEQGIGYDISSLMEELKKEKKTKKSETQMMNIPRIDIEKTIEPKLNIPEIKKEREIYSFSNILEKAKSQISGERTNEREQEKERELERERIREEEKEKEREKEREAEREKEREKEREQEREKERIKTTEVTPEKGKPGNIIPVGIPLPAFSLGGGAEHISKKRKLRRHTEVYKLGTLVVPIGVGYKADMRPITTTKKPVVIKKVKQPQLKINTQKPIRYNKPQQKQSTGLNIRIPTQAPIKARITTPHNYVPINPMNIGIARNNIPMNNIPTNKLVTGRKKKTGGTNIRSALF